MHTKTDCLTTENAHIKKISERTDLGIKMLCEENFRE